MNTPDPLPDGTPDPLKTVPAVPFYKSPVMLANITAFVSAAIALFPKVGQALGLSNPSDVSNAVTTFFAFIAIAAPAVSTVLRAKSKVQPLTLTKAGAKANPNTVANTAAVAAVTAGEQIKTAATVGTKANPK